MKILIYKVIDYVLTKRKNLYYLISKVTEIKEKNVFWDLTISKDFSPDE